VSDLELVLDAVEDARRVLTEYLEPGAAAEYDDQHACHAIGGRNDVVAATRRLRTGPDPRVVK
jgi:hypothetical protein